MCRFIDSVRSRAYRAAKGVGSIDDWSAVDFLAWPHNEHSCLGLQRSFPFGEDETARSLKKDEACVTESTEANCLGACRSKDLVHDEAEIARLIRAGTSSGSLPPGGRDNYKMVACTALLPVCRGCEPTRVGSRSGNVFPFNKKSEAASLSTT